MDDMGVTGTGIFYSSERMRPALLRSRGDGDHVWAMMAAFVLNKDQVERALAGREPVHMDAENLAYTGIGCYACEQPYSPRLATRRCKGEL